MNQHGGTHQLSESATQRAEAACTRCPLYKFATQVVGQGPGQTRLMLVGEQPGDQEDIVGKPFVGPAGRVLDDALAQAGIDRKTVFVTNAVKHFKFKPRGKLHRLSDDLCAIVTIHPSALLRMPDKQAKAEAGRRFVHDFKIGSKYLGQTVRPL